MTAEEILQDVMDRLAVAVFQVGTEITGEVIEAYNESIDMFYNDYTPKKYDRTYSTYKASDNGANNYISASGTSVNMRCGIMLYPENLGSPYKDPASVVYPRTFQGGIHGFPRIATLPPQYVFGPWMDAEAASAKGRILALLQGGGSYSLS